MADTAGTIINNVAVEVGLLEVSNPFTSTDQNFVLLRTLFNAAGNELLRNRDWSQFTREGTITGDGTTTSFALPTDFVRFVNETQWNRTTPNPLAPPSFGGEWQELKSMEVVDTTFMHWRLWNGRMQFVSAPPSGEDIRYEYLSSYWASTSDGASYGTKASCTATTDYVLVDNRAVSRLLKVRWLQAKNLPTEAAIGEWARAYASASESEAIGALSIPVIYTVGGSDFF